MDGDLELMNYEALEDPELDELFEDYDGFSDDEDELYELNYEDEGFDGYDGYDGYEEMEFDPFLGSWVRKAKKAVSRVSRGPFGGILKNLARKAATAAGGALAGPTGARIASMIANRAIREDEYGESEDYEDEVFEDEYYAMGGDPELLAEMEELAEMAAESESEAEADQFLGAIASLASSVLPSLLGEEEFGWDGYEGEEIYDEEIDEEFLPALIPLATSLLPKAIPWVKKGIKAVGKMFRNSPRTRKRTIRALPKIAVKANVQLAKQARRGRKITPKRVAATLARATAKTVSTPRKLAKAAKPSKAAMRASTRSVRRLSRRPGLTSRRRRIVRPRYCVY